MRGIGYPYTDSNAPLVFEAFKLMVFDRCPDPLCLGNYNYQYGLDSEWNNDFPYFLRQWVCPIKSATFFSGDYRYFFNEFLLNKMLISHIIQDFTKRVKAFKFLRPVDLYMPDRCVTC